MAHQPADALTGALAALVAQLGMGPAARHTGPWIACAQPWSRRGDRVLAVPVRGLPVSDGVVRGTGYLQQLARPYWHSSTTWALNSGVNERRRRGFFPMLSMIGHPSGDQPVMMDVRQSGSGPIDGPTQKTRLAAHDVQHPPGRSEAARREIWNGRAVFEAQMLRAGAIVLDGTAPTAIAADGVR